jgi:hypothetical protein
MYQAQPTAAALPVLHLQLQRALLHKEVLMVVVVLLLLLLLLLLASG